MCKDVPPFKGTINQKCQECGMIKMKKDILLYLGEVPQSSSYTWKVEWKLSKSESKRGIDSISWELSICLRMGRVLDGGMVVMLLQKFECT